MRELKTKKLFYGKWPFKVETYVRGASRIHYSGPEKTLRWCLGQEDIDHWENEWGYWGRQRPSIDKAELGKYAVAVTPFLTMKNVKLRCEGGHLNFFTDNKDIVEEIKKALYPWVQAVTSPSSDEELSFLLDNGRKKSLCNKLPHGKYQYKVVFKNKFDVAARANFYKWLDNYGDKIDMPPQSEKWLSNTVKYYYVQDPFVYVEDSKMLSMMLLYLGTNVKKIEEFILRDSINT